MRNPSLPYTMTLKAIGFEWSIRVDEIQSTKFIVGSMTLKMRPDTNEQILGTVCFSSSHNDLLRLADYFDQHITQLLHEPGYESYVFVQYGLEFQVQALSGDVESKQDGDFMLRVMLNIGQATDESRIYVGVEGIIDIVECYTFVNQLRNLIEE